MSKPSFGTYTIVAILIASSGCTSRGSDGATSESIRQGDELVAQKRYGEAVEAYQAALGDNPDDAALRSKLGEAYALSGDAVRAADLLPENLDVQLRAAAVMLGQSWFTDVSARMSEFLKTHPDNVQALVIQGNATARLFNSDWALFRLADVIGNPNRLEEIRVDLRQRISGAADETAEQSFRRAVALDSTADTQRALANFLWATGRFDESEGPLRAAADQSPGHVVANYALGAFYVSRKRGSDAEPYLRNAARAPGAEGRGARVMLADYYIAAGREADARSVLDAADPTDDEDGDVSVRLAEMDARSGKPAEAVRRLDALLAHTPSKPSALLLKAQVLFDRGNPDLRYARAAVEADEGSSEARALLGRALSASGDMQSALKEFREAVRLDAGALEPKLALVRLSLALGQPAEALLHAKDAVRAAPEDRDAVLALVAALVAKPDYTAAEQALGPLAARFPDDPAVAVQSGRIMSARGNETAARSAFLRALQHDAGSTDALSALVELDLKTHPSTDTQARIETAIATRPRDPALLLLAARFYGATNDTARAETTLRKALALDPGNVAVGQALATLLQRERRPDDAVVVLRQVLQRRPQAREVRVSLAILLEDTGHAAEARPLYEQIIVDDPSVATVSRRLAAMYLAEPDRLSQAFDLAMAAKRILPDDPAVNDVLGRAYTLKDLPDSALAPLRAAVSAEPNNALYHFHLGDAYQRTGNLAQARTEYAKALEIDGSFKGADVARQFVARSR